MKDPICGMEGRIKAHGHAFCSVSCIRKYEQREGIEDRYEESKLPAIILVVVLLLGAGFGWFFGFLPQFMGAFLLVVATLKLLDVRGFAMAFSSYDLIAQTWLGYAFVYPFLEFALGAALIASAWLPGVVLQAALLVLVLVMGSSLIGVSRALRAGRELRCACLGALIKVPLTSFTIIENVAMIAMALLML